MPAPMLCVGVWMVRCLENIASKCYQFGNFEWSRDQFYHRWYASDWIRLLFVRKRSIYLLDSNYLVMGLYDRVLGGGLNYGRKQLLLMIFFISVELCDKCQIIRKKNS